MPFQATALLTCSIFSPRESASLRVSAASTMATLNRPRETHDSSSEPWTRNEYRPSLWQRHSTPRPLRPPASEWYHELPKQCAIRDAENSDMRKPHLTEPPRTYWPQRSGGFGQGRPVGATNIGCPCRGTLNTGGPS